MVLDVELTKPVHTTLLEAIQQQMVSEAGVAVMPRTTAPRP